MDRPNIESKEIASWGNIPYGETCIGLHRMENQDAVLQIDQVIMGFRRKTYAVADGVGGRKNGKEASEFVVKKLHEYTKNGHIINTETLFEIDRIIPSGATTLVLAQALGDINTYKIHSAGDSSAYLLDSKNRSLTEITKRDENSKGAVTQVMGPQGNKMAPLNNPGITSINLQPHQTLLLATDGLTGYIDKNLIGRSNILSLKKFHENNNKAFVKGLIDMALACGGGDNIAIVSIPYENK